MAAPRIEIKGDASGVRRAARDAELAIKRMGDTSDHVGKKLMGASSALKGFVAGAAVTGVVTQLSSAADAASDLGEQVSKAGVVFGKSSGDVLKWSETTAKAIGMSRREALEAAGTFGNMLGPMGFAEKQAANMSKTMVQLAGDLASFNNASPEDTLLAIRSGLAGESEPLRKYGVFLNAAKIEAEALRSGLIKQGQTMTDAQKTQAAYNIILKESSKAHGDFQRTSSGMANQQRIARAELENTKAQIGQKMIPVMLALTKAFNAFAGWIQKNWPQIWNEIVTRSKPVIDWMRVFIPKVIAVVKNAFQLIVNFLKGDWPAAWGNLKTVVSKALSGLMQLHTVALKAGLELGKALGRGLGNAVIAAVEAAINKAIDGVNKVAGWLNAVIPGGDPIGAIGQVNLGRIGGGNTSNTGSPYNNGGGTGFASGGVVPGPRGAGDVVPAMLTPGEVVLNRVQQARLGVGRIMGVLAQTGGRIGSGGFAAGGVASNAYRFAQSQLGEPYVWGAGHSFGDSRGWDCSGFATNVAARVPGYTGGISTTMGLWGRMKRARGDEPVVFGFLGMNQGNPAKQHMGVRVNGQWFEAAGKRGVVRGRSSWSSGLWIPPGLESLSEGGNPAPGDAPTRMTPAMRALIGRALGGSGGFLAAPGGVPDGASRAFMGAGVRAGRAAFAATGSVEVAREAQDDASRRAEAKWVNHEITRTRRERRAVRNAIRGLRARLKAAIRQRQPAPVINAIKARIKQLVALDAGLSVWLQELGARDFELDLAEAEDRAEPPLPGTAAAEGGLADQFIRTAFGRGDIGAGAGTAWQAAGGTVNINVQSLTPSDPSTLQKLLQTISMAVNQTGGVPASVAQVGV